MRTRISTKIQEGYLRQQETNEDGAQGTYTARREKAATLESGGSTSGNVGGGRSQVQTSLVQLVDAFSHVQVPLSF